MPTTDHLLTEAKALIAQDWSQARIARHLGITTPTLCRWLKEDEARGQRSEVSGQSNNGSTIVQPPFSHGSTHTLTSDESAALKLGMIQKRSRRLAAEFLLHHTSCTETTFTLLTTVLDSAADKRNDPVWPSWFKRACILTDEERLSFRGAKAMAGVEPARPRGCFYEYVHENGDRENIPLFANAIWEFDDESENTPWVELDADGNPRVNRQTLKAIDVYSSFYLGMRAVSRNSDGYRIEDQADFLSELVDQHGLPLRCRIERGPWDNNFWFGIPQKKEWWETSECCSYRFGGIDADAGGPVKVIQAFKSRQKGTIEGSFNHRQNLAAHETLDIGRFRGEHEAAARHLRRARDGQADAIAAFPEAAARADISAEVMMRFNAEPKRRKNMFGSKKVVPAELYAGAQKRELPASERWRFLPVKTALAIRNYHVQVKVEGHNLPFLFSAEGFKPAWDWHPYLPHGWRLFVAFHPLRPDLGCHIFNALHPDSPQNPARFPLGMPLGLLQHAAHAPHFVDGPGVHSRDFADRKRTHADIRSETRMIKAGAKGARISTVVAAGQVRSIRKGSPDPMATLNLSSGAPPVSDQDPAILDPASRIPSSPTSRSGADHTASSGERAGRGTQDHEAPRKSAGRREDPAAALARLEAEFADG